MEWIFLNMKTRNIFSNYIEIIKLCSTSASNIIEKPKQIYSIHGLPNEIVSDRGSQFCAQEFLQFTQLC